MTFIDALSMWIPVRCSSLVGLDLPLTFLIGIIEKRKKILSYTKETTRAKLERLRSARLIHRDQTNTTRHAKALIKTKELIAYQHVR
jgi:hypothetical protein